MEIKFNKKEIEAKLEAEFGDKAKNIFVISKPNLNKAEQFEVNLLLATQGYSYAVYAVKLSDLDDSVGINNDTLSVLLDLESGEFAITSFSGSVEREVLALYEHKDDFYYLTRPTPETATLLAAFK